VAKNNLLIMEEVNVVGDVLFVDVTSGESLLWGIFGKIAFIAAGGFGGDEIGGMDVGAFDDKDMGVKEMGMLEDAVDGGIAGVSDEGCSMLPDEEGDGGNIMDGAVGGDRVGNIIVGEGVDVVFDGEEGGDEVVVKFGGEFFGGIMVEEEVGVMCEREGMGTFVGHDVGGGREMLKFAIEGVKMEGADMISVAVRDENERGEESFFGIKAEIECDVKWEEEDSIAITGHRLTVEGKIMGDGESSDIDFSRDWAWGRIDGDGALGRIDGDGE
jgi:hypothetical protein